MPDLTNPNNDKEQNPGKDNSTGTRSFLSPVVGETSMNYSVVLDDDDIMDMSPMTPSMSDHPPLHTDTTKYNRDHTRSDYEASHANNNNSNNNSSSNENGQYVCNMMSDDDDINDLPTPLLGHNYRHDDYEDDDRYELRNRTIQDHSYRPYYPQENVTPKLNGLNYLNVITYILNVFTSYVIGVRGLFGLVHLQTRRDVFIKYETLVTPSDYSYWLWLPILVFEFFFAAGQLLPQYRARPIVQQGVGLYFFWACIIQTVWTVFFGMDWLFLSFVAVVLALLCLVFLLASQHYNCMCAPTARGRGGMFWFLSVAPVRQRRKSLLEYWFFRFPFYLHCGWLLVCTVVQFSMAFRYRFTDSPGAQLTADIVALGFMLPPATFFLTGQSTGPDFVIPIVIIWSYISIAVELNHPHEDLVELYGHAAILAVQNSAYVFTGLIAVMLVPRIVVWFAQEFCTIDVVELENDEDEDNFRTTINEVRLGVSSNTDNHHDNDGLFQRISLRRSTEADDEEIPVETTNDNSDNDNNNKNDEDLSSVRRRIENGDDHPEDRNDEGEERYEDCHETENGTLE